MAGWCRGGWSSPVLGRLAATLSSGPASAPLTPHRGQCQDIVDALVSSKNCFTLYSHVVFPMQNFLEILVSKHKQDNVGILV